LFYADLIGTPEYQFGITNRTGGRGNSRLVRAGPRQEGSRFAGTQNGMSSVRDADYIGVLIGNDIIIDDLKRIRNNCITCSDVF